MAVLNTYTQVGKKEDVSNVITNIDPTKTPFQTTIGRESIHNVVHSWQEDTLDAPASNAQVEGADAPTAAFTATTLRSNNTQIFAKTAKATGTSQAVQLYGRSKELPYQLTKKSKEIKRDLEKALLAGASATAAVGSASVARTMGAAQSMINAGVTVTNSASALTEANILSANQKLYSVGGEADILMIKPADALILAGFTAATGRTRYIDGASKTVVNAVNSYMSPYGEQKVVMNLWQPTTDAILFSPSNWKLLVLRNWNRIDLAVTGDAKAVEILGEFSLKHVNFNASALVTGLT